MTSCRSRWGGRTAICTSSWPTAHRVVLEKVLPFDAVRHRRPRVTGGRRACPPEDCGGLPGFYAMLEILDDPEHAEHEEMLEWVGGAFDADDFDPEETNALFGASR